MGSEVPGDGLQDTRWAEAPPLFTRSLHTTSGEAAVETWCRRCEPGFPARGRARWGGGRWMEAGVGREGGEPLPSTLSRSGLPSPSLYAARPFPLRGWEISEKHSSRADQEAGGGPGPTCKVSGALDEGRAPESGAGGMNADQAALPRVQPGTSHSPPRKLPLLSPVTPGGTPALAHPGLPRWSTRKWSLNTGGHEKQTQVTAGRLHALISSPDVP